MTSNNIEKSLSSIQRCNSKQHLYLKVIGTGDQQYLEAVRVNWFGRLLMWLGCGNACLKKVARFMFDNRDKLFEQASAKGKIKLKILHEKLEMYDSRHGYRMSYLISKISETFAAQGLPKPVSLPLSPEHATPALVTLSDPALLPRPAEALPSPVQFPLPSGPVQILPPSGPVQLTPPAPVKPYGETPAQAPLPAPTPKAIRATKLQSVDELAQCHDRKAVYDLLRKYGQDETQFKALLAAIAPQEIYDDSPAMHAEALDMFGLAEDNSKIKPEYVVRFMSMAQLQQLIKGYFVKHWEKNEVRSSLLPFGKNILAYRLQSEHTELFDLIVRQEVFSPEFMSGSNSPIQNILKSRYLLYIMRNMSGNQLETKLKEFILAVWKDNMAKPTFLHDPNFQKLFSTEELVSIALVFAKEFDTRNWKDFPLLNIVFKSPECAEKILSLKMSDDKMDFALSCCSVDVLKNLSQKTINETTLQIHRKYLDILLESIKTNRAEIRAIVNALLTIFNNLPNKSAQEKFDVFFKYIASKIKNSKTFMFFIIRNYHAKFWADQHYIRNLLILPTSTPEDRIELFLAAKDTTKTQCLLNYFDTSSTLEHLPPVFNALKVNPKYNKDCLKIFQPHCDKVNGLTTIPVTITFNLQ